MDVFIQALFNFEMANFYELFELSTRTPVQINSTTPVFGEVFAIEV